MNTYGTYGPVPSTVVPWYECSAQHMLRYRRCWPRSHHHMPAFAGCPRQTMNKHHLFAIVCCGLAVGGPVGAGTPHAVTHHKHESAENTVSRIYSDSPKVVNFVHISKAAGTSFLSEMPRHGLSTVTSREACLRDAYDMATAQSITLHMTMVRSPRAHILSMFLECAYDAWGRKVTANTMFPRSGNVAVDFEAWLVILHFRKRHSHGTPHAQKSDGIENIKTP